MKNSKKKKKKKKTVYLEKIYKITVKISFLNPIYILINFILGSAFIPFPLTIYYDN